MTEPAGLGHRLSCEAARSAAQGQEKKMNSIIYLVGLVVIVVAILSFIGIG